MGSFRRGLRSIAYAWLAMQLVALAAAPVALCAMSAANDHDGDRSAGHHAKCCRGIAPGQMCPMHRAREGARTCSMRAPCDVTDSDSALLSLFTFVGVHVSAATIVDPSTTGDRVLAHATAPIVRPELPDPPPPRA